MEVKCFDNVIALTQATKQHFFALKKTHFSIAKTYNHVKFLRRCKKHHLVPRFLLLHLPFESKNSAKLQLQFGRKLLLELLDSTSAKLARLQRTEVRLRHLVQIHVTSDQWTILRGYILSLEHQLFLDVRARQISKFEALRRNSSCLAPPLSPTSTQKVINLSDRPLDNHEFNLLNKGLKFVPFNNRFSKLDLATSTEFALFCANTEDNSLQRTITDHFNPNCIGKDNLSFAEREALTRLKTDQNICILSADKGNSVVIMNKVDYTRKLDSIVFSSNYSKLSRDPSPSLDNKIRKIVRELKKLPSTPKNIAAQLIGYNSRDPSIYGLPKVHKPDTPLRPIVTTYGSVFEFSSKFVTNVLNHYLEDLTPNCTIKNSITLVSTIKALSLPSNFLLVSFDVINLFGSVDLTLCLKLVHDTVDRDPNFEPIFNIPKRYFFQLLDICVKHSYFKYKNEFFQQNHGVAMGSPCSPALADFVMRHIESAVASLPLFQFVFLWRRYVDDILSVWTGTVNDLNDFLISLNSINPSIQFSMELETNNSLPFLDVRLTKSSNSISFSMYSKPTDSGFITNFTSFHPPAIKTNIIKGETTRYLQLSDTPDQDLKNLETKFLSNSYPYKVVRSTIDQCKSNFPPNKSPSSEKQNSFLVLPYMGKFSQKLKKRAKKLNLKLVSKKNSSLGSIFSSQFKYRTSKKSNLIYKIPCTCGEFYVGETGVALDDRIKRHKYAVKTFNRNNGIADHCYHQTGHQSVWDQANVLDYECHVTRRKIKEAIFIQKLKPGLNQNNGFKLKGKWDGFV